MLPTIKSRSFILRPFRKGDEISLQRNINDKAVYRYTLRIPYPYTIRNANEWVKSSIVKYKKKHSEVQFAIVIKSEVVGGIGFRDIKNQRAEIGYWLAKKNWGRGIMTQAVKLVCKFGFLQLGLRRVYAAVFANNKASARVLEKSGFKYDGRIKRHYKKDGRLIDALMYAKVKKVK